MSNVPEYLYKTLLKEYGEETLKKILEGYSKKRAVTLRVNTLKKSINEVKEVLSENKIAFSESCIDEVALILENANEEKLRTLELYKNGEIYLQSLSSMIPAIILNPKENENILDMCAAPGGKTMQMSAISNGKALITACEKNKVRSEKLKYNIEKQNSVGINVLVEDARNLSDFFSFDKILLDAPCSGSGTILLNNEKTYKFFNEELVNRSRKTQFELLKKAVNILKPEHEMIYSTCSILKEENEFNLEKILKQENIEIVPIENEFLKNIETLPVTINGTICICPSALYEGFFVAKLRKIK